MYTKLSAAQPAGAGGSMAWHQLTCNLVHATEQCAMSFFVSPPHRSFCRLLAPELSSRVALLVLCFGGPNPCTNRLAASPFRWNMLQHFDCALHRWYEQHVQARHPSAMRVGKSRRRQRGARSENKEDSLRSQNQPSQKTSPPSQITNQLSQKINGRNSGTWRTQKNLAC